MTEVLFYHLTSSTADQALPALLQRCIERDWKVVVQTTSDQRLEELDGHLWTFRNDSFLPHASALNTALDAALQPVWLTADTSNPNKATVRFLLDGAVAGDISGYQRIVLMFDGRDEDAVRSARERWKIEKSAGHQLTYWQQDEEGRWSSNT